MLPNAFQKWALMLVIEVIRWTIHQEIGASDRCSGSCVRAEADHELAFPNNLTYTHPSPRWPRKGSWRVWHPLCCHRWRRPLCSARAWISRCLTIFFTVQGVAVRRNNEGVIGCSDFPPSISLNGLRCRRNKGDRV
jgi:hypothetical protein